MKWSYDGLRIHDDNDLAPHDVVTTDWPAANNAAIGPHEAT
jgi:hypothetical protein